MPSLGAEGVWIPRLRKTGLKMFIWGDCKPGRPRPDTRLRYSSIFLYFIPSFLCSIHSFGNSLLFNILFPTTCVFSMRSMRVLLAALGVASVTAIALPAMPAEEYEKASHTTKDLMFVTSSCSTSKTTFKLLPEYHSYTSTSTSCLTSKTTFTLLPDHHSPVIRSDSTEMPLPFFAHPDSLLHQDKAMSILS